MKFSNRNTFSSPEFVLDNMRSLRALRNEKKIFPPLNSAKLRALTSRRFTATKFTAIDLPRLAITSSQNSSAENFGSNK